MGYEMIKLIFDILFGVCILGLGLYVLITPYEKLKAKNPKMKSEKVIKTCGILLVISGAMIAVASILLDLI